MNYQIDLFRISFKFRSFSQPCYIFLPFLHFSFIGSNKVNPTEWKNWSWYPACWVLWITPEACEIGRDPLASSRHDSGWSPGEIRMFAPWGWMEVGSSFCIHPVLANPLDRNTEMIIQTNLSRLATFLGTERNRGKVQFFWDILLCLFSSSPKRFACFNFITTMKQTMHQWDNDTVIKIKLKIGEETKEKISI